MRGMIARVRGFLWRFLPRLILSGFVVFTSGGAKADEASRSERIAAEAEAMRPELVARRRDIHEHPEMSNREERTSALVAARLKELGFDEIRTNVARRGVVALLKGGKPGPVVAVRADMDALPINEIHNVPYKS